MRISLASTIAILLATASGASAQSLLVSNMPITPVPQGSFMVQDGTFSDSLASGGNNYWSQALAQGFSLSATSSLTSLTFWGATEYINSQTPWNQTSLSTNIYGFQVAIFRVNDDGSMPQVANWYVSTNQITQALTGNYTTNIFSPVFQISCQLAGGTVLEAGKYAITIGGRLVNGDGDAFAWTDGQWDGSGGATQAFVTTGDIPSQWGTWLPVTDGTSGAFQLYGTVPAPGTLAFLALGAMGSRRRRH